MPSSDPPSNRGETPVPHRPTSTADSNNASTATYATEQPSAAELDSRVETAREAVSTGSQSTRFTAPEMTPDELEEAMTAYIARTEDGWFPTEEELGEGGQVVGGDMKVGKDDGEGHATKGGRGSA